MAGFAVAAFCATHTPPPVVPRYSVLPVKSEGSRASDETRPVTKPKFCEITAAGPSSVHAAAEGDHFCGLAIGFAARPELALGGRLPRKALPDKNLRSCLTRGGTRCSAAMGGDCYRILIRCGGNAPVQPGPASSRRNPTGQARPRVLTGAEQAAMLLIESIHVRSFQRQHWLRTCCKASCHAHLVSTSGPHPAIECGAGAFP